MQTLIRAIQNDPTHQQVIERWELNYQQVIEQALTIQAIPAPTFEEASRAAYVETIFREIGLQQVEQDDLHNVYGFRPGEKKGGVALLVSAHLDTVFPIHTDLTSRRSNDRISGPGLGDNSLGLAAMISLARALNPLPCDTWWVATIGEEGLGNLQGIRRVVERLGDEMGLAIILEGIGLGRVYHAGLGVRRLQIDVSGPGGHSWLHARRPSAIHHLMRIGGALVDQVTLSDEPRTSFNIGVINGGTSVNTRAPDASMSLDMRSDDADALTTLEEHVRDIINSHEPDPDLTVSITVIGDRPSATLPQQHPLVQAGVAALHAVDYQAVHLEIGSTDANIPLAAGIPSVCVGITTGGNAHTNTEYINVQPVAKGMRQLTLLALLAAENIDTWQDWNATQ